MDDKFDPGGNHLIYYESKGGYRKWKIIRLFEIKDIININNLSYNNIVIGWTDSKNNISYLNKDFYEFCSEYMTTRTVLGIELVISIGNLAIDLAELITIKGDNYSSSDIDEIGINIGMNKNSFYAFYLNWIGRASVKYGKLIKQLQEEHKNLPKYNWRICLKGETHKELSDHIEEYDNFRKRYILERMILKEEI